MENPAFVVELDKDSAFDKNGKKTEYSHTFEEAITLTSIGKFHYLLLLYCGLTFMTVMVEIMGVSIILPSLKCDLPSTLSQQGLLASAGFFGVVLSSHAMGFLADTAGRVRTLRIVLILSTISTIISAFSVNIWMLIVFRFLSGFFISGGQACVFSLVGEFHGNKTRVRHVTLLSGFLPLALIHLPAVATFILPLQFDAFIFGMKFSPWRLLLISNAVLSMLTVVGLFQLPETPKYLLVQGDHDGALETLRSIYAQNTGCARDDYPVKSIVLETGGASLTNIHSFRDAVKMIWNQTAPLFYKERFLHTLNICLLMFVIYFIAQGFFMWFPTILNELTLKDGSGLKVCHVIDNMNTGTDLMADICAGEVDTFTFKVLILIGCAFTVFYLIFSFTIDFIGKKNLLIGWLIISGLCVIIVHWIADLPLAVVVLTLIMSVGNCGGIVSTISMEFFPTNINAMGMCFIMMIGRLGAVVGSNIIGQVIFGNCDNVYWIVFGVICVLCIMAAFLPERKRERTNKKLDIK